MYLIYQDLRTRSRYQGQGHIIAFYRLRGVPLLVLALDACFWHTSPHMFSNVCVLSLYYIDDLVTMVARCCANHHHHYDLQRQVSCLVPIFPQPCNSDYLRKKNLTSCDPIIVCHINDGLIYIMAIPKHGTKWFSIEMEPRQQGHHLLSFSIPFC